MLQWPASAQKAGLRCDNYCQNTRTERKIANVTVKNLRYISIAIILFLLYQA